MSTRAKKAKKSPRGIFEVRHAVTGYRELRLVGSDGRCMMVATIATEWLTLQVFAILHDLLDTKDLGGDA